jgi:hypothetical protein
MGGKFKFSAQDRDLAQKATFREKYTKSKKRPKTKDYHSMNA